MDGWIFVPPSQKSFSLWPFSHVVKMTADELYVPCRWRMTRNHPLQKEVLRSAIIFFFSRQTKCYKLLSLPRTRCLSLHLWLPSALYVISFYSMSGLATKTCLPPPQWWTLLRLMPCSMCSSVWNLAGVFVLHTGKPIRDKAAAVLSGRASTQAAS